MPKEKPEVRERIRWTSVPTQLGTLLLAATDRGVVRVTLPGESKKRFFRTILELVPGAEILEDRRSLEKTAYQLAEYTEGRRQQFDLPLDLRVSPFQGRVLAQLRRIPFGQTRTYGEIAALVGKPRAARAVGFACNRNPIPLLIPCHRVVGHDQSMVGFGGGVDLKKRLLRHEGALR